MKKPRSVYAVKVPKKRCWQLHKENESLVLRLIMDASSFAGLWFFLFVFLPRKEAVRMLPSPIKLLREKCKQVQL